MSTSTQPTDAGVITLTKRQISSIIKDPVKTAEAVNLIYVSNTEPGIIRKKKGDSFVFLADNKKVKDKATLQRIKSLVIPPAWEEVWICKLDNGHLQTTGLDVKKTQAISLSSFVERSA